MLDPELIRIKLELWLKLVNNDKKIKADFTYFCITRNSSGFWIMIQLFKNGQANLSCILILFYL
jgi:hypothetical protein